LGIAYGMNAVGNIYSKNKIILFLNFSGSGELNSKNHKKKLTANSKKRIKYNLDIFLRKARDTRKKQSAEEMYIPISTNDEEICEVTNIEKYINIKLHVNNVNTISKFLLIFTFIHAPGNGSTEILDLGIL